MIRLWSLLLLPWFFSFSFLFLFPIDAAHKNTELFIISVLIFLSIIIFVGAISYLIFFSRKKQVHSISKNYSNRFVNFNYGFLLLTVIFGSSLLIYDRIVLRGINYFSGDIRSARYMWLASEGGNFSGVLGNLLIPFAFVGVYFSIKFIENKWKKISLIILSILGIMLHSFLNGGRSNIFILIVLLFSLYTMSSFSIFRFLFKKFKYSIGIILIFIIFSFYISQVISSSASIGDVTLKEILWLGSIELYGSPEIDFFSENYPDFIYILLYSLMYIFHGQWTHQAFFNLNDYQIVGFHFLSFAPTVFLDGIGIIDLGLESRAFSDTGAFITLVGAVLYDFGWLGLILFSIVIGISFGYCLYLKKIGCKQYNFISFFIIFNTLPLLILAPVLSVYGFAYFSFIAFAFFAYWLLNFFIFKKSTTL